MVIDEQLFGDVDFFRAQFTGAGATLEAQQRRQRQAIFQVEDEIMVRRDGLIDALERRQSQRTRQSLLFTLHFGVQ